MSLPFKLVYHEGYDLNLGPHVFPSQKFRLIRERFLAEGFAEPSDFATPERASDDDVRLVHEPGWVTRLKNGTLDYMELMRLEIPYSREMVDAFWLAAGGSALAARLALRDGIGFNIGGGFHHAFPDHGEGFCAIHDVAVAIRKLQQEGLIERAMTVDTDVHPVLTLKDGTGDEEYLRRLEEACRKGMDEFRPQLVMYVAGSDPYREDKLGGLDLSIDGLKRRDRLVFDLARERGAAVAVTLAGGYAQQIEDTITIHANTAHAAAESMRAVVS